MLKQFHLWFSSDRNLNFQTHRLHFHKVCLWFTCFVHRWGLFSRMGRIGLLASRFPRNSHQSVVSQLCVRLQPQRYLQNLFDQILPVSLQQRLVKSFCFFVFLGFVYRQCDLNGSWVSVENRTWVNYSDCLRFLAPGIEKGKVSTIKQAGSVWGVLLTSFEIIQELLFDNNAPMRCSWVGAFKRKAVKLLI